MTPTAETTVRQDDIPAGQLTIYDALAAEEQESER